MLNKPVNPYPYFKKANLFVMSSRKEGYPNVVLEALTLGVPVVATDVVDWTGVIKDGKNGYIAKKNNVDMMIMHVKKFDVIINVLLLPRSNILKINYLFFILIRIVVYKSESLILLLLFKIS